MTEKEKAVIDAAIETKRKGYVNTPFEEVVDALLKERAPSEYPACVEYNGQVWELNSLHEPVYWIGPDGPSWGIYKPVMLDLIECGKATPIEPEKPFRLEFVVLPPSSKLRQLVAYSVPSGDYSGIVQDKSYRVTITEAHNYV